MTHPCICIWEDDVLVGTVGGANCLAHLLGASQIPDAVRRTILTNANARIQELARIAHLPGACEERAQQHAVVAWLATQPGEQGEVADG